MSKKPQLHAPILVQTLFPLGSQRKPDEEPQLDVDLIIADYLHRAKHYKSMPTRFSETYETDCKGGSLFCACCADRNRESLQKKYPMLHRNGTITNNMAKDLPEEHRQRDLEGYNPKTLVNSQICCSEYSHPYSHVISKELYQPTNQTSPCHALHSWGYYQPVPSVATFLNPDFNRPFVKQLSRMNARDLARHNYITRKVMDASSKYEHNMKKLQEQSETGFVLSKGVVYLRTNKTGTFDIK